MIHTRKESPRMKHRLEQKERIEGSPSMAEKFPRLKALTAKLEYLDAAGASKGREMKCKVNVQHAKSVFCFACPGGECVGGDFDLSEALAKAVAGRRKVFIGEIRCQGKRTRGDRERVPCHVLLHYKLTLAYA